MASRRSACGMDPEAYVLGELTSAERDAFRLHLTACADCRERVDDLESAIRMMPRMADYVQAPPRVTLNEQVRGQARARVMRAREARARDDARVLAYGEGAGLQARSRRSRTSLRSRRVTGVVALALAVALTIALSFASPGTTTYQAAVAWSPGGGILRVSGGKGELLVSGMPAAGDGRAYEVWTQRGRARPRSTTARFQVDVAGRADVELPGDLGDVSRVLVSSEPAKGSETMSETPVLIATLNTSH